MFTRPEALNYLQVHCLLTRDLKCSLQFKSTKRIIKDLMLHYYQGFKFFDSVFVGFHEVKQRRNRKGHVMHHVMDFWKDRNRLSCEKIKVPGQKTKLRVVCGWQPIQNSHRSRKREGRPSLASLKFRPHQSRRIPKIWRQ